MDKSVTFAEFADIAIPTPTGNFVPYCLSGDLLYLAGQTCSRDDKMLYCGQVCVDLSVAEAKKAARVCMQNLLSVLYRFVDGDLARVAQCVKVNGYVNSVAPFSEGPAVINGASDLVVALMGDLGRHARTAVGVSALPGNAAVEVEAIFRLTPWAASGNTQPPIIEA
jgi:enamine deaminase RidA (YjgF/YER057c/UK114 family)